MTARVLERPIDDEDTLSCRYLLCTELGNGEVSVRQPLCEGEPVSRQMPSRWVLVPRPAKTPDTEGS